MSTISTRTVISVISLCDRRRTCIALRRGVPLALAAPASAKTSRAVRIGHGPSSEFGKSCDTNVALSLLTQPARSRARPAREYASKTSHTKTKHRARTGWVGALISKPADRSAALLSARLFPLTQQTNQSRRRSQFRRRQCRGAAENLAPPPSGRSRARALRASAVGRAASVVISPSRLESMSHYHHLCIGVGIASSESSLSRTSTDRIAKVGYLIRWVVLTSTHASLAVKRDILISKSMRRRVGTDHDTIAILSSAHL